MQPAANPDDIHTILSRFQTWAEQPANGNGNGHKNGAGPLEGVREIPYEEAMRQHRNRRVAQGQRRAVSPRASVPPFRFGNLICRLSASRSRRFRLLQPLTLPPQRLPKSLHRASSYQRHYWATTSFWFQRPSPSESWQSQSRQWQRRGRRARSALQRRLRQKRRNLLSFRPSQSAKTSPMRLWTHRSPCLDPFPATPARNAVQRLHLQRRQRRPFRRPRYGLSQQAAPDRP